jgi:hypothetical protein
VLVDALVGDVKIALALLDGEQLSGAVAEVAVLLAELAGQDVEEGDDGVFRVARRVAKDRIISTVDPEARHGHKTAARGFDGFKGHIAIDPDSEIIVDTVVTAGNAGDASVAVELIDDLLAPQGHPQPAGDEAEPAGEAEPANDLDAQSDADADADIESTDDVESDDDDVESVDAVAAVYGDAAYGTGEFLSRLEDAGIDAKCKTQPPVAAGGRFSKDQFYIDLADSAVTCPAGEVAVIRWDKHGGGSALFGECCATCPLAKECTISVSGRRITIGPHEEVLAQARQRQGDPDWAQDYRATRPKVERKLGHLTRRKHGGRRARVRGTRKVNADFNLLAAAANMSRLAVLGLHSTVSGGWTVAS